MINLWHSTKNEPSREPTTRSGGSGRWQGGELSGEYRESGAGDGVRKKVFEILPRSQLPAQLSAERGESAGESRRRQEKAGEERSLLRGALLISELISLLLDTY